MELFRVHEFQLTLGRRASEEGDKTSNIVDDIGSGDEFQIFAVESERSLRMRMRCCAVGRDIEFKKITAMMQRRGVLVQSWKA